MGFGLVGLHLRLILIKYFDLYNKQIILESNIFMLDQQINHESKYRADQSLILFTMT